MKKIYKKVGFLFGTMLCLMGTFVHAQSFRAFATPMAVPALLDSTTLSLTMDREVHNFNDSASGPNAAQISLNQPVNTFAFNHAGSTSSTYLGPTLIWNKGDSITLRVTNNLDQTTPTSPETYNAESTVHLHGAHVAAWVDGGPHGKIRPGDTRSVSFRVRDDATTLWYHPHGIDETYTQVEMGLAGIIIVQDTTDPAHAALPHTYGQDDFPIVLQDHVFTYSTADSVVPRLYTGNIDTCRNQTKRRTVVNGVTQPYLNVPPQRIRFRLLDGSSRLSYNVGVGKFNAQTNAIDSLGTFYLIGSDGGYLSGAAVPVTSVFTGPGIRNEFVIDFSGHAGETLYLLNLYDQFPSIYHAIIKPGPPEGAQERGLIQFKVGQTPINPAGPIPAFATLVPYDSTSQTVVRVKQLIGAGANGGGPATGFSINQNQFDIDEANDIVREGTTEVWQVENLSSIAHPFHIHDIQFYVTRIDTLVGANWSPLGSIPVEYQGRKDDVLVPTNWRISFVTKFEDFGRPKPFLPENLDSAAYMYHCHILTHEDGYYAALGGVPCMTAAARNQHGMMQQFVVWNGVDLTSEDEVELTEGMVLYPNPAGNQLFLRGKSTNASQVKLYDLQGRLLRSQAINPFNGDAEIDIFGLSVGLVLVEWSSPKGTFTKKVVLQ